MTDWLSAPWSLPLLALAVLLAAWLAWKRLFGRGTPLEEALGDIAFERIEHLVIPSADEGEIQIDQLLLTSEGLLILEIKDVTGTVFGSDKMSDWTVIANDRRFTFPNPQPALYDRVAAVRQIVRQVPVEGRVLFLDGAEFTKGVPSLACSLDQLVADFGASDKSRAKVKIEAFMPHWELIRKAAG
jgi:hypothetical protein